MRGHLTSLYLAYGSNLHPDRLREREIDAELVKAVRLEGWQIAFHKVGSDRSGKCNILEDEGTGARSCCWGAVFRINAAGFERLDEIEGSGYSRNVIDLPGVGTAFTYRAIESAVSDRVQPYTWYRALVAAGARFHCFPREYIDTIENVPAQVDHDDDRHRRNARTLDLLTRSMS